MTTFIVYIEHVGGSPLQASLDCIGAAHAFASRVVAVLSGHGASAVAAQLGRHGAACAVVLRGGPCFSPGATAAGLATVVRQEGARGCLAMDSCTGRDLIPRVAAHLDCTFFGHCTDLSLENGSFTIRRPCFSSRCIATWRVEAPVLCATLSPKRFPAVDLGGDAIIDVREIELPMPRESIVALSFRQLQPTIDEAGTVVLGGHSLGQEGFRLLEELAATIGDAQVATTSVTRRHPYVGLTARVAPRLCIAVGLGVHFTEFSSFADSEVIVAIDQDPRAGVLGFADYAIVGDPLQVLPTLISGLRQSRSMP